MEPSAQAPLQSVRDMHVIGSGCRERFLRGGVVHGRLASLALAGLSELAPPYAIGRVRPNFHLVLCTVAGAATLALPSQRIALTEGTALLAPAGLPHGYAIDGGRWRIVWFHFREPPWPRPLDGVRVEPCRDAQALDAALGGLVDETLRAGDDIVVASWATVLERLLARVLGGGTADDPMQGALDALWRRVDADLARDWTVAELAERVHVSPAHLHRLCRARHGCTPMRLVARLRMERARALVEGSDWPLRRIAAQVGYDSEFALSTAFKRHWGASPAQVRSRAS